MFRKGHAAALSRTIVILSLYVLSYTFIPIEAGVHVLHVYSSIGIQNVTQRNRSQYCRLFWDNFLDLHKTYKLDIS